MAKKEIFLQPGEWFFGDRDTCIRTLLGSCIAITLWHPRLLIGGMCHFLLPARADASRRDSVRLDGRFGDEAMAALLQQLRDQRTHPSEYVCKIFGGGNMFRSQGTNFAIKGGPYLETSSACRDVPCKNVRAARELVSQAGFQVTASHLGGHGHRNLYFELWSGDVYLKFTGHSANVHPPL